MGKGKTSQHYKDNPESAEKHREYQRKYNKTPKAKKSRAEDNKARKDLGLKKGDPRDASRKTRIGKNGKLTSYWAKEHQSKNRGSTSNQPGDRRARGKNKK
jgi:hypothetical protein